MRKPSFVLLRTHISCGVPTSPLTCAAALSSTDRMLSISRRWLVSAMGFLAVLRASGCALPSVTGCVEGDALRAKRVATHLYISTCACAALFWRRLGKQLISARPAHSARTRSCTYTFRYRPCGYFFVAFLSNVHVDTLRYEHIITRRQICVRGCFVSCRW